MLVDRQNREHFSGMTREQINQLAGGKSPEGKERKQAEMLKDLNEVHTLKHNKNDGFSIEKRARFIDKR